MKEPVDHIARPSLPWRQSDEGAITECGHEASEVKTITREQFLQREKDLGKQRSALFTCMTCADTSRRWKPWNEDPRLAIAREVEWERGGTYWRSRTDRGMRLQDELLAIASLIEAHREEFDVLVNGVEQRRDWLEKKAVHDQKQKINPRPRLL